MLHLIQEEILAALKGRGIVADFARFQRYAGSRLDASAGRFRGFELTGNCRLRWYEHLFRNPLVAIAEAEQFTRELHLAARGDHTGLCRLLGMAAEKLDLPRRESRRFASPTSPQEALESVKAALSSSQMAFAEAMAPLTKGEIRELATRLYPVFTAQNQKGHTLADRPGGRRLCDLIEKLDRDALHRAGEALVPLTDPQLLEQLKHLAVLFPENRDIACEGVAGQVLARLDTPGGAIIVGGKGNNIYQMDNMAGVAVVIDLGGNDTYIEGVVSLDRPVLVIIDLAGNDVYRGTKPGIQGAAILGVSMLLDYAGDDVYQAKDVAQGSCVAGIGLLIDYAGNDNYLALRRAQGQALGGLGILIDRDGDDGYRAALWAQGFGGPLGFGLLDDLDGKDHYFCGGHWPDSYEETPGLEGWGQGVGAGPRQVANGGIGVILDGGGDDVYEFDYMAHGGGYWCGLGFARDFGGNDQRLITRKSYNGGQRTEAKFQRFGCGWGCHYALGFLIDDQGDDMYGGTIMGTGMAWDCAVGVLCDFGGNDRYEAAGGLTQGIGAQAGFGVLFDYDGDDTYAGSGQGYAPLNLTYHDLPACGGNFSFLIDYGGEDRYGCNAKNNSFLRRGGQGGFLIDRPRHSEMAHAADKSADKSADKTPRKETAKKD
jgi:hypothetical protein